MEYKINRPKTKIEAMHCTGTPEGTCDSSTFKIQKIDNELIAVCLECGDLNNLECIIEEIKESSDKNSKANKK